MITGVALCSCGDRTCAVTSKVPSSLLLELHCRVFLTYAISCILELRFNDVPHDEHREAFDSLQQNLGAFPADISSKHSRALMITIINAALPGVKVSQYREPIPTLISHSNSHRLDLPPGQYSSHVAFIPIRKPLLGLVLAKMWRWVAS
ncbi:hypothetical protein VKT23_006775 [Stygiomarasmius scandens]|uniref:Uncharacterized protein n=1 Tax=Marasmiellus scandens TaxID=2682957 RepID=A0ABR1JQ47_9AGAR